MPLDLSTLAVVEVACGRRWLVKVPDTADLWALGLAPAALRLGAAEARAALDFAGLPAEARARAYQQLDEAAAAAESDPVAQAERQRALDRELGARLRDALVAHVRAVEVPGQLPQDVRLVAEADDEGPAEGDRPERAWVGRLPVSEQLAILAGLTAPQEAQIRAAISFRAGAPLRPGQG